MDEKKELEKLKKQFEKDMGSNLLDKDIFDKIKSRFKDLFSRIIPDRQDSDDLAYIMVMGYLQAHGFYVFGDDVLNSKDKKIAEIGECNYDGMNLYAKIKVLNSVHYVEINITLDDIKVDG